MARQAAGGAIVTGFSGTGKTDRIVRPLIDRARSEGITTIQIDVPSNSTDLEQELLALLTEEFQFNDHGDWRTGSGSSQTSTARLRPCSVPARSSSSTSSKDCWIRWARPTTRPSGSRTIATRPCGRTWPSGSRTRNAAAVWTTLLPAAQQHILAADPSEGKQRFCRVVYDLSRAFALRPAHAEAIRIRDDVAFFQAVRAAFLKSPGQRKSPEELDQAIRQLVSKAVTAGEEVIDVFSAAGLKKPDISILSDEFLAEVRNLPHKNLAVELLRKLLSGEIKVRRSRNVVQARQFSDLLQKSLQAYTNRVITTHEVIDELIRLAKDLRDAGQPGDKLKLTDDELAFYDALAQNESAVQVMGDEKLAIIARELVDQVKRNVSIDWTIKETVRAKMRVLVKMILRKYGYPPDLQEAATTTALEQAEVLCGEWAKGCMNGVLPVPNGRHQYLPIFLT